MLTRFGPQAGPTGKEVKDVWGLDDKTTIVIVDPTSPNILAFNTGRSVEQLLSRSFFIELQSRYGNKFFVRDEVMRMTACLSASFMSVFPAYINTDHLRATLHMWPAMQFSIACSALYVMLYSAVLCCTRAYSAMSCEGNITKCCLLSWPLL